MIFRRRKTGGKTKSDAREAASAEFMKKTEAESDRMRENMETMEKKIDESAKQLTELEEKLVEAEKVIDERIRRATETGKTENAEAGAEQIARIMGQLEGTRDLASRGIKLFMERSEGMKKLEELLSKQGKHLVKYGDLLKRIEGEATTWTPDC